MRWPFRRRGRHAKGRVVFVGPSPLDRVRAGASLAALPDPRPATLPAPPSVAPVAAPSAAPPAAPAAAPPSLATPFPAPPAAALPSLATPFPAPPVRLGFTDGSEVALAADDPAASALRDLADRLADRS